MQIQNDIVYRKLDGEEIILHLKTGTYFGLNQTGTFLFECLKSPTHELTIESLCQKLTEEFDVDLATAKKDVESFLTHLKDNQLVTSKAGCT